MLMPSAMTDDEADDDASTENKMTIISRALGVDRRLADSELLAFVTNKQVSRLNAQISRATILEIWSCIPSTFKVNGRPRDVPSSSTPRVILVGANPRSASTLLSGTRTHPQLTRLVVTYIRQVQPEFLFTTFAIREDLPREPHRDVRNGPGGTFFQTLNDVQGGGLWIAHNDGDAERIHNNKKIRGFYLEARQKPVIFDARRFLHASGVWDKNEERIVLIAWTVIHARTLTTEARHELLQVGFPLPSSRDLDKEVPTNWIPAASSSGYKKRRLEQSLLRFSSHEGPPSLSLQGSKVIHHVD